MSRCLSDHSPKMLLSRMYQFWEERQYINADFAQLEELLNTCGMSFDYVLLLSNASNIFSRVSRVLRASSAKSLISLTHNPRRSQKMSTTASSRPLLRSSWSRLLTATSMWRAPLNSVHCSTSQAWHHLRSRYCFPYVSVLRWAAPAEYLQPLQS